MKQVLIYLVSALALLAPEAYAADRSVDFVGPVIDEAVPSGDCNSWLYQLPRERNRMHELMRRRRSTFTFGFHMNVTEEDSDVWLGGKQPPKDLPSSAYALIDRARCR